MNFRAFSTPILTAILTAVLAGFLTACSKPKQEHPVQGDLQVQIPLVNTVNGEAQYKLQVVTLKNIASLREVRGSYARFYFAPGMVDGRLSGNAPASYFAKTSKGIFIPKDQMSLQMATLYYHMQSLMGLAQDLGVTLIAPFQIGLNTRIKGDESLTTNNAFYDGRSKAMLFVPYTFKELPIAVNAGIVAHEFFHSIFYSKVLEPLAKKHVSISQNLSDETVHVFEGWRSQNISAKSLTDAELFNETYIRGINEGLADFWGWLYTSDPDFLKWSLSRYKEKRTLQKQFSSSYKTDQEIENEVIEARKNANNPSQALSNFIYDVGTPYARFLKELVQVKSESQGITLSEAKKQVGQFVIEFIDNLGQAARQLKVKDKLSTKLLFIAAAEKDHETQTKDQCELIISYLNSTTIDYACEKQGNSESYQVIEL